MARKSPPKTGAPNASKKKPQKSTPPKPVESSVYSHLAKRTHELWREQLTVIAASPAALREMNKAMQPALSLFTQGLDLWLMVADPLSTAAAFSGMTSKNETPKPSSKKIAEPPAAAKSAPVAPPKAATPVAAKPASAPAKNSHVAAKNQPAKSTAAVRAKPAAAGSGSGHPSMAELARRVAGMERAAGAIKAAAASPKASSAKASSVIGFEEAAGRRLSRRRKA